MRGVQNEAQSISSPSFGELLRKHRLAHGLAQETLAERARLSVETISALERGTRLRPYRATVSLIANALQLSTSDRLELERAATRSSAPPSEPKRATSIAGTNTFPAHFSSFVGREDEVANVKALIETQRLVTLVGAGGVGKTRLALHAAEDAITTLSRHERLDGVWFVDLSPFQDGSMVPRAIASSIGLEQCAALDPLIGYLRNQKFLLILDNCEHLLGAAGSVAQAIALQCPNAKILATSRQSLALEGERVYRVPTLAVPPDHDSIVSVAEVLNYGAIRLFVDRAVAADSRFELTATLVPTIADICRRLDGIALAIELAAARTAVFSPAVIAQRLAEHFLALTGGSRAPLPRHKTMRALFDWSYELLDDNERYVFRGLSIFNGGFTFELASALCTPEIDGEAADDILASLVDKSLVQRDIYADPPRYRLLEPARQYAREKLRECGELNGAARAHALALLELAEDYDSRSELTSDREWDSYVEPEQENFRAAIEWALGAGGDSLLAQRLTVSRTATWFGFESGDVRQWVRSALETCDEATPRRVRAKLEQVFARAVRDFARTDAQATIDAVERALRLQDPEDLAGLATAQVQCGHELLRRRHLSEGEAMLRDAVSNARSCNAQFECAMAMQSLAIARAEAGDVDEARELILETLQQYQIAGCDRLVAHATISLAELEFVSGHTEIALERIQGAIEFLRTRGTWSRLAIALSNSSAYLLALGRYEEARGNAREALLLARKVGVTAPASWALQHLAAAAVLDDNSVEKDSLNVRRAAQILGFVDQALTKIGYLREYTEREERDKMVVALRKQLGEEQLEKLITSGQQWSVDQAVATALTL